MKAERELLVLSYAQERLWFVEQLGELGSTYNVSHADRLEGTLDRSALESAARALVRRHDVLRVRLTSVDGTAWQYLDERATVSVRYERLEPDSNSQTQSRIQRWAQQEADGPFTLSGGPLFRLAVLEVTPQEHVVVMTLHHIICDAWSFEILRRDLFRLYESFHERSAPIEASPSQPYVDFASWQRRYLQGSLLRKELDFWTTSLENSEPLTLPVDRMRPPVPTFRGDEVRFEIDPALTASLQKMARAHGATLYMILLCAVQILLGRLSGSRRFAIGTPVAARTRAQIMSTVGFFTNTLAVPVDLTGDPTVSQILERVKEVSLACFAHQEVPFEKIVAELRPQRDLAIQPLFNVMFSWVGTPAAIDCRGGLRVREQGRLLTRTTAKFDLLFAVSEPGADASALAFVLEYATDLFERATIERFAAHLRALLAAMVESPERSIFCLPILSAEERHRQLVEWNRTARHTSIPGGVHELFAESVHRTPDADALLDGSTALSYRQLDQLSRRLATRLPRCGVRPEHIVGLCVEPSASSIAAVLGTLQAGAACLPLDPDYPGSRLALMLKDSGARVLICSRRYRALFEKHAERCLKIMDVEELIEDASPDSMPLPASDPESIAYVLYTSGSTGQPKAVAMRHAALSNLIVHQRTFDGDPARRVLHLTPLTFDVSFQEIFATFSQGATLVIGSKEARRDSFLLLETLVKFGIHDLYAPQVLIQALAEGANRVNASSLSLSRIYQAGEALKWTPAIGRFFARRPGGTLHNHYGPTETHVATMFTLEDPASYGDDVSAGPVPIGRPVSNTQIYVLDEKLMPVPVGVTGDLYIAGAGLARGYLGRPGLTAARFVANPFGEPGARMYRTGDLAVYREDGTLYCLGRSDHQVKIRGYRVEPGEIETILHGQPGVEEAVVVAREDASGQKQLIAYLLAAADLAVDGLRRELKASLPEFMVPAAFVKLQQMPRLSSGKIDRAALPALEGQRRLEQEFIAPHTPLQERLAGIWSELLGVDQVGIEDNFFELGGHSVLALKLIARINDELGERLPVRALFESPTIGELSEGWLSHCDPDAGRPAAVHYEQGVV